VDADATRSALTKLPAPVLLLAGQYDVGLPPSTATSYAGLFADAELTVQPGAGHYPWLDDPTSFTRTISTFLRR
jgi:pimeloyl-ACP methyl ester carboxylesterase